MCFCFSFKIGASFVTCNSSKADNIFASCDCNGVGFKGGWPECCRGFLGRGRLFCLCGGSSWECGLAGERPHPLDVGSLKLLCVKIGVSDWLSSMTSCRK